MGRASRVGVAHAGMMACVEGARVPQVAAVYQIGARVRALRRRSLEHALLCVVGLAHVDEGCYGTVTWST